MANKRQPIYFFGNGKAEGNAKMRETLGGKGAGLHEITRIGVPVPPGFTIKHWMSVLTIIHIGAAFQEIFRTRSGSTPSSRKVSRSTVW